MSTTVADILKEALEELAVYRAGETFDSDDEDLALRRYNRLLDYWNAEREAVYADQFVTYTLTPNLAPHTLGPTGATWTVTQRPVSVEGVNLWIGGSPNVKKPINLRSAEWWNAQRVPSLGSAFPTDVWIDFTWPNASFYFWPVPDTAYQIEVWTRIVLAQVTTGTTFTLPPAYWRAHVLSLAEECAEPFGVPISERLATEAAKARARIFGNNRPSVPLTTRDAGMPTGGRTKSFNWLTRTGT